MATKHIINCANQIDWLSIVTDLTPKKGKEILFDQSAYTAVPGYQELFSKWNSANFNAAAAKWINYYPDTDFSNSVTDKFSEIVGVTHIRSWISRIDPGCCTPWHWDVDDNEEEYLKLGKLRRFICHIGEPDFGHVLLVEKECHYFKANGDIYEWDNYRAWHGGMNCGTTPKFLYSFLGYN